ncbi:MAG TPA: hypothetical protein DDX07_03320 [Porphyromonadaceae bacterium]|nr:hypothetical protein [Porphyromonadaceae bacterium]
MRKGGSFKIKFTVIAGYLLVVIVMTLGLYGIYRNLVIFSNQKIKNEDLSELLIVGNTLSKLYEIESNQNLFTAESARQYFLKYDSIAPEIDFNLSLLKQTALDTSRVAKIDTIKLLIQEKKVNLQAVATLLDSMARAPELIRTTRSSLVPRELNREVSDFLERNNLHTPHRSQADTSVVLGKRKGFLDRVRNVFVASSDSTIVIKDKSVVSEREFKVIVDTLINKIRYSEKLDLARQKEFQLAFISRLDTMSYTNRMLTARIDDLLKGIEQEEMRKSFQLILSKEQAITGSQRTMFLVSCLAILIALVFGILFLVDINKSQRYRRQLESSHSRISQLLASREKLMLTISHDIKSPVSSILGYIDLMDGNAHKPEEETWLRNMKHSGEHVLHLVSMLLDHHKLEAGTWQLRQSNFRLFDLVEETADSFRPLALQKGLCYSVENHLPPEKVSYGDQYVIRQILSNLISNAIKYTPAGSVSILAETKGDDVAGWFRFSVSDTGEGIDAADQQYIFQEFSRLGVRDDDAGNTEGSGLGLAITKGFVEALQGSISLVSEKEKGSEFVVELPLYPKHKEEENSAGEMYDLEDVSVLVVDDDPIQLNMMAGMLQKKKMHCVVEANPRKTMALLSENMFDIVFMDLRMPQIDGVSLVEKVRHSKDVQEVPVIALSAGSEISAAELQEAGFTDFLPKPVTSGRLYAIIHRYVKGEKPEAHCVPRQVQSNGKGVEALIDFVRDDEHASRGILQSFISETLDNIDQLRKSFAEKDGDKVSEIAHKMLPLFQMMGDVVVIDILQQMKENHLWPAKKETVLLKKIKESVEQATALKMEIEREGNGTPFDNE